MNDIGFAYLGAFIAGAATGIGALISFISDTRSMYAFASAFSGGAMLWISFAEIYFTSVLIIQQQFPKNQLGSWIVFITFFSGYLLVKLLDRLIPEPNLNKLGGQPLGADEVETNELSMMKRTGLLNWIILAIHNIPEGLASFVSWSGGMGAGLIIAIGFHNICEGFCIAAALNSSRMKKWKTFLYTLLSGFTELIGAGIGHMIKVGIDQYENHWPIELVLIIVAGIMTCVSIENLLKQSVIFTTKHELFLGIFSGMAIMAITLIILSYFE